MGRIGQITQHSTLQNMKTTHLLLAALLLLPCLARAQSQVPGLISYQGIVTDTGGNLVGNAAPVNREVFFRIWDSSTASLTGNLVYSERQVVTISKGEFSVLIGQGAAVTGTPLGYSETGKGPPTVTVATAFAGSGRYLGVTVDDGTAAADVEITPRQQMVSTAFTIRAREAETLTSGTITGGTITGAVTATGSTFTGGTFNAGTFAGTGSGLTALNASNISSGTLADARLSGNVSLLGSSIESAEITNGTIATADLADASVTKVKLGTDVGVWDTASGNVYRSTGNVGIGTALMNAGRRLTLGGVGGICIGEEQTTGNTSLIMSLSAVTNGYANIQAVKNQGGSLGDIVLNGGGGNVGIGMTAPPQKLSISNGVIYQDAINGWEDVFQIARGGVVKAGISMDVAGTSLRLFTGASSASPRLTISAGGNVGIGATSPGRRLQVGDEGVGGSVGVIRVGHNNGAGSFRTWDFGIGDSSIFGATDNFGFRDLSGGTIMTLQSTGNGGNVGIGRTDPGFKLDVNGGIRCVGAVNTSSDARLKTNIQGLADALEKTLRLRGVSYDWNRSAYPTKGLGDKRQLGFVAQEVRKVLPDVVMEDAEGFLSIGYTAIIPVLTEAVKELHTKHVCATQELARKVEALEKANAEKDTALTAMTQRLAALEARDKVRDAKLAAIESMLSGDKPAALPVSLKKSVGGAE